MPGTAESIIFLVEPRITQNNDSFFGLTANTASRRVAQHSDDTSRAVVLNHLGTAVDNVGAVAKKSGRRPHSPDP